MGDGALARLARLVVRRWDGGTGALARLARFSSIKRKFGAAVCAKDLDAQINEALLVTGLHNIIYRIGSSSNLDGIVVVNIPRQVL